MVSGEAALLCCYPRDSTAPVASPPSPRSQLRRARSGGCCALHARHASGHSVVGWRARCCSSAGSATQPPPVITNTTVTFPTTQHPLEMTTKLCKVFKMFQEGLLNVESNLSIY